MTGPGTLDSLDASCASQVAPIRAVGVYASSLAGQPPLAAAPGNQAPPAALRLGAVAVATAGDARARYEAIGCSVDRGLHGGTVTTSAGGIARLFWPTTRWCPAWR